MMQYNFVKEIVRAYDIRGVFGINLTEQDAFYLALKVLSARENRGMTGKICIGYDGRASSPCLHRGLLEGLKRGAVEVLDLGLVATPMLYFAASYLEKIDAAVMITGSHNPYHYNGFKIILDNRTLFGEELQALANLEVEDCGINAGFVHTKYDIMLAYLAKLKSISASIRPFRIAWDPGNGAACVILRELVQHLPGEHYIINGEIDPYFSAHSPDPSKIENLGQLVHAVKEKRLDLGIAFDGDADRLGVIDRHGNMLSGGHLLYIFVKDLLLRRKNPSIIIDTKMSTAITNKIRELGCNVLVYKTGHALIKAKMRQENAVLAGEMSGHLFFAENYFGFDDAIFGACKLLQIISQDFRLLQEAWDITRDTVQMPEIVIPCAGTQKIPFIESVKSFLVSQSIMFNAIDGIRVDHNNDWWLIRASNTEDIITVMAEAGTPNALQKIIKVVHQSIAVGKQAAGMFHFNTL